MEADLVEKLRPCQICRGLTEDQIARIAASCSWRELEPEETLTYAGDSVFALYTVIHGRLRMYREASKIELDEPEAVEDFADDALGEGFFGYANLGDTVGQASLLSDRLDRSSTIIADMKSEVAILNRGPALRMMFELPAFRENLIVAFGNRVEQMMRGKRPGRIPKVVGIVSSRTARTSLRVMPLLAAQLQKRREKISVLTDRASELAAPVRELSSDLSDRDGHHEQLLTRIRERLPETPRILVDIVLPQTSPHLATLLDVCDEILWCCENALVNEESELTLRQWVLDNPSFRSRIKCVQILEGGETIGRAERPCAHLELRDFLLQVESSAEKVSRLQQQGFDRIVRHLRGVKFGLALGGGGARGLAHLGVLKVLDRAGLGFDLMSGTSAGAMIGVGYAAGMPPDALIDLYASELQPPSLLDRMRGGRRLFLFVKFRAGSWESMLRKHYHDWSFEQLAVPFAIVATDLVSGDQVINEQGDVVRAILDSINIPVMSEPILRDGKILVDGGVLNNMPVDLLSDRGAQYVIGVDVSKEIPSDFAGNSPGMPTSQMKKPGNLETAYRIMEVSRRGIAQLQMSFADHVIEPDTSAFDFADFTQAEGISRAGEEAAEKMLPEISRAYEEMMMTSTFK